MTNYMYFFISVGRGWGGVSKLVKRFNTAELFVWWKGVILQNILSNSNDKSCLLKKFPVTKGSDGDI